MVRHYLGVVLLFLAVAVAPGVLELGRGPAAAAVEAEQLDVPPEALEALRQGRYWRASRILRGYLASTPNPRPETILLAAQAEAGWGAGPPLRPWRRGSWTCGPRGSRRCGRGGTGARAASSAATLPAHPIPDPRPSCSPPRRRRAGARGRGSTRCSRAGTGWTVSPA